MLRYFRILFLCALIFIGAQPHFAYAQEWRMDDVAAAATLIADVNLGAQDIDSIQKFYDKRAGGAFWTYERGVFTAEFSESLIERLQDSWSHGLNPDNYLLDKINSLEPHEFAQKELYLMEAFLRYAQDLSGIRVRPRDVGLRDNDWRKKASREEILAVLHDVQDIDDLWKRVEPQGKTYQKLRRKLRALWPVSDPHDDQLIDISGIIKPETHHDMIPEIRRRLNLYNSSADETFYDMALVNAVVEFQYDRGLYADGIIGPKTIHELNKGRDEIVKQIIVNLERMRWLPDERPLRYVMVNIPSARLWAIDNGRIVLEMDVMVGKPQRPTESFVTTIDGVRLNPTWTVPETIKKEDIWPKLQGNTSYLNDKGIEVYGKTEYGPITLNPDFVNWEEMSWDEVNALRFVQGPGDNNPLGRVRILMPNNYNIYLHSTNDPKMFENYDFAVSSGCMRMREPKAFANYVLSQRDDWTGEKLDEIIETNKTRNLFIKDPIPVYILYQTIWLRENGEVVMGHDLYNLDEKLWKALKKLDASVISQSNNEET